MWDIFPVSVPARRYREAQNITLPWDAPKTGGSDGPPHSAHPTIPQTCSKTWRSNADKRTWPAS